MPVGTRPSYSKRRQHTFWTWRSAGTMDLGDFMDVVTTYKCKFCVFTSSTTEALADHIKAEHLKQTLEVSTDVAATPPAEVTTSVTTDTGVGTDSRVADEAPFEDSSTSITQVHGETEKPIVAVVEGHVIDLHPETNQQPITKEVFLCGQCNAGFGSIDECKNHMICDHNLNLQVDDSLPSISDTTIEDDNKISTATQVIRKKPGRKRKADQPPPSPEPVQEEVNERLAEDGSSRGKRPVRLPKALQTDYLVQKFDTKRSRTDKRDLMAPFRMRCKTRGCGARFKTEEALEMHMSCHAQGGFACFRCDEKGEQWQNMRMHLWKAHSLDTDLFVCDQCDFHTNSATRLLNHKAIHGDERPHLCRYCGKGFKQYSQARNHEVCHNPRNEDELGEDHWSTKKTCDICNRTFVNIKSLKKHVECVHDKVKPFFCPYCPHTASRKAMMQLHMRTHTGEKPFKCDVCTYSTGDHNSLRRHRMRHTGQKPYKCAHCAYSCIQAISLKMHMKSKHMGEEGLYVCKECPFHTINKKTFEEHLEDHKNGLVQAKAPEVVKPPPVTSTSNVVQASVISGPSEISSAQFNLIYSALNAISQNSGTVSLGTTVAEGDNQTQTITIHLPTEQVEGESVVLAVGQPSEANVQDVEFVDASQIHMIETEQAAECVANGDEITKVGEQNQEHVAQPVQDSSVPKTD